MDKRNKFRKFERITSKITIDKLFDRKSVVNSSFLVYPIKTIFYSEENQNEKSEVKILISVSSKKFKNAVERNIIKRRIREAYRTNKIGVNQNLNIVFIYVGTIIEPTDKIEKAIIKSLQKIGQEV